MYKIITCQTKKISAEKNELPAKAIFQWLTESGIYGNAKTIFDNGTNNFYVISRSHTAKAYVLLKMLFLLPLGNGLNFSLVKTFAPKINCLHFSKN